MRGILILSFLFLSGLLFAQPGVVPTKVVDGVTYHLHTVKPGNTLWGLQTMYNVPVNEIMKANPGLNEGIHEGQVILIPVVSKQADEKEIILRNYKVKNKETLYGISRKFNTTVDELIRLNPELSEGLKKGQEIKVPSSEVNGETQIETENPFFTDTVVVKEKDETVRVTFSDTTIRHRVLPHETLYSISNRFMVSIEELMKVNGLTSATIKEGQILIIPVKKEEFSDVKIKTVNPFVEDVIDTNLFMVKKDAYNIALLLPFFLEHGPGHSQYVSDISTQYYLGAMAAKDSLEKLGLKATLFVYDTKNDTNKVRQILARNEFKTMDMVIGPLYGATVNQVAMFCRQNRIRMVCPLSTDNKLLKNNPYVYSAVTSDVTLFKGLAKFLAGKSEFERVVLIQPTDAEGKLLAEAFKMEYLVNTVNGITPTLIDADNNNFSSYLKKGVKVALVYPTSQKTTVIKFMSKVNIAAVRSKEDEVYVFGTKDWVGFEDINNVYKNKYNFHYPGSNYLDYYSDEMMHLNTAFRLKYNTDLSKFAVQSYDVLMYFATSFFMEGQSVELLMNDFNLHQVKPGDGFENGSTFIIGQENYELKKVTTVVE